MAWADATYEWPDHFQLSENRKEIVSNSATSEQWFFNIKQQYYCFWLQAQWCKLDTMTTFLTLDFSFL